MPWLPTSNVFTASSPPPPDGGGELCATWWRCSSPPDDAPPRAIHGLRPGAFCLRSCRPILLSPSSLRSWTLVPPRTGEVLSRFVRITSDLAHMLEGSSRLPTPAGDVSLRERKTRLNGPRSQRAFALPR